MMYEELDKQEEVQRQTRLVREKDAFERMQKMEAENKAREELNKLQLRIRVVREAVLDTIGYLSDGDVVLVKHTLFIILGQLEKLENKE